MGRMHSKGKGMSGSALPYKRTPPSWLKVTSAEVRHSPVAHLQRDPAVGDHMYCSMVVLRAVQPCLAGTTGGVRAHCVLRLRHLATIVTQREAANAQNICARSALLRCFVRVQL
jgi:hypothetical protein